MSKKVKNLIIWESAEEIDDIPKWKINFKKILSKISKYSGLIETLFMYLITFKLKASGFKYWIILLIITGYFSYRTIKIFYKVYKSKLNIKDEEINKRVIGTSGSQGSGKTSSMFYISSVMKRPIFTSAPAKINGEFTYKLSDKILNMEVKVPYGSIIVLDEISLYYDNSVSKFNSKYESEGLETQMQLIRHCYDGQMLTASVNMNRVSKRIEEKHGMFRHMLGQYSKSNSLFIDPFINIISFIFKLNVKTGIRIWRYQTFENIQYDNYNFDLSNQTANTNYNHFANLNEIWAFNSNIDFEYDDRYFKKLYLQLPKANLEKWEHLAFDFEELKTTGFTDIGKFFEKQYNKAKEGGK